MTIDCSSIKDDTFVERVHHLQLVIQKVKERNLFR